jgi:Flp pilus assembly protein TadD
MPSILSTDVAHTQVTDHRIPRRPPLSPPQGTASSVTSPPRLVPFPDSEEAEHDVRDLALAWETLAEAGMDTADEEARRLLRSAIADSPDDPVILSAFGYLEQRRGAIDHARELYEKALALDPTLIDAATNLGVIEAKSGHWAAAVRFWKDAFQRAPARSGIGMNLVRAFCGVREFDEARSYTLRILEFNPDMGDAKELLRYLNRTPASCGP